MATRKTLETGKQTMENKSCIDDLRNYYWYFFVGYVQEWLLFDIQNANQNNQMVFDGYDS